VADLGRFAAQWDEIGKIDFLLDQLARAVERGEIPLSSYEALAPGHLARRADLIALVSAQPTAPAPRAAAPAQRPPSGWKPTAEDFGTAPRAATPVPRPQRKPVPWTTVLLFLGAFLVVVASAIFAVAVWDLMGTGGKFAFLGTLTAGFYAAGWWARTKLELRAGSTALVTVASAMLLLDGWILIDGYNVSGLWPWAVLLLACSAAYWATEIWLAERFFGVIGAAAQMGWWWLLGAGLGLPVPARLAGMALVVVAWQFAAERGADDRTVGSLAQVLAWAAPVTSVLLTLGVVADLVIVGSAGAVEVAYAAVVSASAAVVLYRSRVVSDATRALAATLVQAPTFAIAWLATADTGSSWWIAAVFLLLVLANDGFGYLGGGLPFVITGLLAELSLVLELCLVLDVSAETTVAVVAVLATLWSAAARMLGRLERDMPDRPVLASAAVACESGAFLLLVGASVSVPLVTERVALLGPALPAEAAVLAVGVLAAWWACATIKPNPVLSYAGSLWAFYTLAALESWLIPGRLPAVYAIGLTMLAGVWTASGWMIERQHGPVAGVLTRLSGRVATGAIAVVGMVWSLSETPSPGAPAVLAATAALVFALDVLIGRFDLSAAAFSVFAVIASALGGWWLAVRVDRPLEAAWAALAGAVVALVIAAVAAGWRTAPRLARSAAALAAATTAMFLIPVAAENAGWVAVVAVLVALTWACAAATTTQWLAAAAGFFAFVALIAWLVHADAQGWTVVWAVRAGAYVLGAVCFVPLFGPGGRLRHAGMALAVVGTGCLALYAIALPVLTDLGADIGDPGADARTVVTIALAVLVLVQGARWRLEPAYYLGGFIGVLAVWQELGTLDVTLSIAYALPFAFYISLSGYLFTWLDPRREYPIVLDAGAVLVGLGYPLLAALQAPASRALAESLAVVAVALVAIALGVGLKVRWYLFGGTAALAIVAVYRSMSTLVELWWIVLGVVGIAMLVVALTWERQRVLVTSARERLHRSFEGWR